MPGSGRWKPGRTARQNYYGVGMTVIPRGDRTVVMSPYEGTPAYKAGIRPGDIIAKIDNKQAQGLTTTKVADLLRGNRSTEVKITVSREGYAEPLVFSVTRDEIHITQWNWHTRLSPASGTYGFPGLTKVQTWS